MGLARTVFAPQVVCGSGSPHHVDPVYRERTSPPVSRHVLRAPYTPRPTLERRGASAVLGPPGRTVPAGHVRRDGSARKGLLGVCNVLEVSPLMGILAGAKRVWSGYGWKTKEGVFPVSRTVTSPGRWPSVWGVQTSLPLQPGLHSAHVQHIHTGPITRASAAHRITSTMLVLAEPALTAPPPLWRVAAAHPAPPGPPPPVRTAPRIRSVYLETAPRVLSTPCHVITRVSRAPTRSTGTTTRVWPAL